MPSNVSSPEQKPAAPAPGVTRKQVLTAVLIAAVVVIAGLVSRNLSGYVESQRESSKTGVTGRTSPKSDLYTIKYSVTGSAKKVDVTYINSTGGTEQESDVLIPWEKTFICSSDDFVSLSAQNQGERGDVTVTIYKDGDVLKTSSSKGAYVIANASAALR